MPPPLSLLTLARTSWKMLVPAAGASLLCGTANVLLVVAINEALHRPEGQAAAWLLPFFGVAALALLSQVVSRALFAHCGQRCLATLRRSIAQSAIEAPYRSLETVGGARIQALLTEDANAIAAFFAGVPIMATNAMIVAGCLGYLAYLSPLMFLAAVVTVALGSVGYHLCHQRVLSHLRRAAQQQDALFRQFDSLVAGGKELRLNRAKAARFRDGILGHAIDAVGASRARGLALLAATVGWGRFLFLVLIGAVLFAPGWTGNESAAVTTGYVVALLFVMGPLEGLLVHLPELNLARVALDRIAQSLSDLRRHSSDGAPPIPDGRPGVMLSLRGVTHDYFDEQRGTMFTLGPIDLELQPGEITFLVGGNGSGKTTLAKLITGLYHPMEGRIAVDGRGIEAASEPYRQLFSAVFADFHLFDALLEAPGVDLDARANAWLKRLQLDHRVQVTGGAFTTRALSQGQRKRLALIAACLEDRPVMVFDEWAADQDPTFRDIFYRDFLMDLRTQGKTLLVITHDDRYFDLADQLVKLEQGRIVERAAKESR